MITDFVNFVVYSTVFFILSYLSTFKIFSSLTCTSNIKTVFDAVELPAQSKRVCFELTRLRNLCVRCFQRRPSVVCDPSVAGAQFRIPPGEGRKGRTGGKGQNQVHEIYGRQIIIHIKYYIGYAPVSMPVPVPLSMSMSLLTYIWNKASSVRMRKRRGLKEEGPSYPYCHDTTI